MGGSCVEIGSTYAAVYRTLAGFPEEPAHQWREQGGISGERYDFDASFLGYPHPHGIEFVFKNGRLVRIESSDPEGIATGIEPNSKERVDELRAEWAERLGPATESHDFGENDRVSRWRVGPLDLIVYLESRTPSLGIAVQEAGREG